MFIEAARRYYAFDLVPQFWTTLIAQAKAGRVRSVDRVKAELDKGKDLLANWANSQFAQWFAETSDSDVLHAYGEVMVWGQGQAQFTNAAKAEFARAEMLTPGSLRLRAQKATRLPRRSSLTRM